jgi:hypothetical protein
MRSSPIYNKVYIPGRAFDRSFGADADGFSQDIRVGTSASNSHTLADIEVRRFSNDDGTKEFVLYLDGIPIKKGTLDGKEFELNELPA